MSITEEQLQFIINSDVEQIVAYLQADEGLTLSQAFGRVYNSPIYKKLINTNTGLYPPTPTARVPSSTSSGRTSSSSGTCTRWPAKS